MPKPENIEKAKDPDLWIQDYWNAWFVPFFGLYVDKKRGELKKNSEYKVKTFEEYVSEKVYYGQRCDMDIIPELFIKQNDRLVSIYNTVLKEEPLDFDKLERVTNLAHKVVYREYSHNS